MLRVIAALVLLLLPAAGVHAGEAAKSATLYKTPQCGCCEEYANYLREHDFEVEVVATHDLPLIKRQHGVPDELAGCHTMLVDGYVVEGHVPIRSLRRLLEQRPKVDGISLPGMPAGSPGMTGEKSGPFAIHQFDGGKTKLFYLE